MPLAASSNLLQRLLVPGWRCRCSATAAAAAANVMMAPTRGFAHQQRQPQCQQPQQQQQQQQQQHEEQQEAKQQQQEQQQQQRLLSVAVVGLPNAGKSTLVNRLAGTKISGVSSKRNTTIDPQLGAFTTGDCQVLLFDTPGLVEVAAQGSPLCRLRSAWATAAAADLLLLIVDAERQFRLREPALLRLAQQLADGPPADMVRRWGRPPAVLFLNKQDKLPELTRAIALQQLERQLRGAVPFAAVFEGAAMRGQGVQQLRQHLIQQARPGAWLLPASQAHAATPGELAVELVREKLYRRLNQELPYRLNVVLQAAQSTPDGAGLHIRVGVEVRNKLMKSIVIGRRGDVIQRYVTLPTQAELCRVLGQPVKLLVSVRALQD